jgi:small multidrug resistance pump
MPYVYLMIAILAEVVATTSLKESDGFTKPVPALVTLTGYAIAFYFLSLTLRDVPTGIAYAVWSGVGIVLITVAAWLFHGQKLDAPALIGMGLIIAGVIVMNGFSRASAH